MLRVGQVRNGEDQIIGDNSGTGLPEPEELHERGWRARLGRHHHERLWAGAGHRCVGADDVVGSGASVVVIVLSLRHEQAARSFVAAAVSLGPWSPRASALRPLTDLPDDVVAPTHPETVDRPANGYATGMRVHRQPVAHDAAARVMVS